MSGVANESAAGDAGGAGVVGALHSLDSYDVVYDGQEHDDTKSVSHLDWPFLIKVRAHSTYIHMYICT